MVVPTASGMIYDSIARVFASEMGKIVGQPIVVQNVVGAGMALGSQQVYQAKPDGYTIHYAGSLALIVNQYVYNAKYDWRKFEYLAQIYDNTKSIAVVAVTGTKGGLSSWNDVLKLTRPVRFGITGKGSPVWVSALSLAYGFGLKDGVYVTGYKGGAEMLAGVALRRVRRYYSYVDRKRTLDKKWRCSAPSGHKQQGQGSGLSRGSYNRGFRTSGDRGDRRSPAHDYGSSGDSKRES